MRFGLVGTGHWAREVHAAGIASHPDAELVGVWGRDPAKAAVVGADYGAQAYARLDDLLDAVEAVAICVPPDAQVELARRAAVAGRHLLLEKPLAIGLTAAQTVVDAVEGAGVAAIVFFTERFLHSREAWLDSLRAHDDWLGADAVWLGSLDTPDNPFANSAWRKKEGALWDLGPHALSVVLPLLGPVVAVAGARGRGDLVHLVLTHESGSTSTVELSLTMPPQATRFDLQFCRADGWHRRPELPFDPADAYAAAIGELIAMAPAGKRRHRCDVGFGRDVVAVLDLAAHALDDPIDEQQL
jgi:predicted dehydrogenase